MDSQTTLCSMQDFLALPVRQAGFSPPVGGQGRGLNHLRIITA